MFVIPPLSHKCRSVLIGLMSKQLDRIHHGTKTPKKGALSAATLRNGSVFPPSCPNRSVTYLCIAYLCICVRICVRLRVSFDHLTKTC